MKTSCLSNKQQCHFHFQRKYNTGLNGYSAIPNAFSYKLTANNTKTTPRVIVSQLLWQTAGSNKESSQHRITCAIDSLSLTNAGGNGTPDRALKESIPYVLSTFRPRWVKLCCDKEIPPAQYRLHDVSHLPDVRHPTFSWAKESIEHLSGSFVPFLRSRTSSTTTSCCVIARLFQIDSALSTF